MKTTTPPAGFNPLFAVVADFHWLTPMEKAIEDYIMGFGQRRGYLDRRWRRKMRTAESISLGMRLLGKLREYTGNLISLGDHHSHIINVRGLAQRRARIAALVTKSRFEQFNWNNLLWVPSDHDIGVPHQTTGKQSILELEKLDRAFEETTRFDQIVNEVREEYPDQVDIIDEPSAFGDNWLERSQHMFSQIFGPLSGQTWIDNTPVIWCSDAVLAEEAKEGGGVQTTFLNYQLQKGYDNQVFCVHSPQALKIIDKMLNKKRPGVGMTLAGHVHVPWWANIVLSGAMRENYNLTVCQSLAGGRFAPGGGLLVGKIENNPEYRAFRYSVDDDLFWPA